MGDARDTQSSQAGRAAPQLSYREAIASEEEQQGRCPSEDYQEQQSDGSQEHQPPPVSALHLDWHTSRATIQGSSDSGSYGGAYRYPQGEIVEHQTEGNAKPRSHGNPNTDHRPWLVI